MRTHKQSHRARIGLGLGAAVLALVAASVPAADAVSPSQQHAKKAKPTVVLVHGAWADSSSWAGVVGLLQDDGYKVVVIANPLHGLASDSAYLKDYLATIPGPIVLVGHSYGGAVVTNAATGNANVKALVYVDAFAPDQGESVVQLASAKPGSALAADPTTVFSFAPFPGSLPGDVELTVLPKVFRKAFANDLPRAEGNVLAATQRPVAGSALQEPSGGARLEDHPVVVPRRPDRRRAADRGAEGDGPPGRLAPDQDQGGAPADGLPARRRRGDHPRRRHTRPTRSDDMDLDLTGRVAVVTGASKGIGLAITTLLVEEGVHVFAGAREPSAEIDGAGRGRPRRVRRGGPRHARRAPPTLVDAATSRGRLDILVNNVGAVTPRLAGFMAVTDEQWTHSLNLNLMAAVRTTRAALPAMLAQGKGAIVTTSSVNAHLPDPSVIDYSAAKAALSSFCKSLSKEVGPQGIRINTVSPGPVATDLWLGSDGVAATIAKEKGGDAVSRRRERGGRQRHRPVHHAGRGRQPRRLPRQRPGGQHHRRRRHHRRRSGHDPLTTHARSTVPPWWGPDSSVASSPATSSSRPWGTAPRWPSCWAAPAPGRPPCWTAVAAGRREQGVRVVEVTGQPLEADLAFAALVELLVLAGPHESTRADELDLISSDPLRQRLEVLRRVEELADGPVLIVVDDAQWIDASSLSVLAFVANRIAGSSISMVVAARGEVAPPGFAAHPVVPLPRLDTLQSRLVVRRTGLELDDSLIAAIVNASAGNPLALVELARAAASGGGTPTDPMLPIPERLERAFAAELPDLPAPPEGCWSWPPRAPTTWPR